MRPIDADAFLKDMEHGLWDWNSVDGLQTSTALKQVMCDIQNEPTVDAVPVVRCKDCKYHINVGDTLKKCIRFAANYYTADEDYCSQGERDDSN